MTDYNQTLVELTKDREEELGKVFNLTHIGADTGAFFGKHGNLQVCFFAPGTVNAEFFTPGVNTYNEDTIEVCVFVKLDTIEKAQKFFEQVKTSENLDGLLEWQHAYEVSEFPYHIHEYKGIDETHITMTATNENEFVVRSVLFGGEEEKPDEKTFTDYDEAEKEWKNHMGWYFNPYPGDCNLKS